MNEQNEQKSSISAPKKIAFYIVGWTFIYCFGEIVCSTAAFVGYSRTQNYMDSFWIFEESGRTVHFDPVRGYRLTTVPSRSARITYGQVEYVGNYKGNEQGFPDEDDFTVEIPAHISRRYIVFGDSFTSAQFLQKNWPEVIEEQVDDTWQLLNFATGGGGLANWWSNLTKIIDQEGYKFDGVIFAIYEADLRRGFSLSEHRGYDRYMFGQVPSWNPEEFPKTSEEAKAFLRPRNGYILQSEEFEEVLRTKRLDRAKSTPPTIQHFWIAYNTYRALKYAKRRVRDRMDIRHHIRFTEGQLALIQEISQSLSSRNVRPIVVHIPTKKQLLEAPVSNCEKDEAKEFARLIGARFVDGSDASEGLTPALIQEDWLPYDSHWGQGGSDRFARFLMRVLGEENPDDTKTVFRTRSSSSGGQEQSTRRSI